MSLWNANQNGFLFVLFALLEEATDILAQVWLIMNPVGPLSWWYFSLVPECIIEIATVDNGQNPHIG